jgi:hypothetical protein
MHAKTLPSICCNTACAATCSKAQESCWLSSRKVRWWPQSGHDIPVWIIIACVDCHKHICHHVRTLQGVIAGDQLLRDAQEPKWLVVVP